MKKIFLSFAWGMLPLLTGCALLSVPGQERGVQGFLSDNALRLKIMSALTEPNLEEVEILIHQGRVLVLGVVGQPATRTRALSKIKQIVGVREVLDEIEVGPETAFDYSRDTWVGNKMKLELFFDPQVASQNYHVRVVNRVMYILGTAQDKEELERVLRHAESIQGVKRVVPYVEMHKPGSCCQDKLP